MSSRKQLLFECGLDERLISIYAKNINQRVKPAKIIERAVAELSTDDADSFQMKRREHRIESDITNSMLASVAQEGADAPSIDEPIKNVESAHIDECNNRDSTIAEQDKVEVDSDAEVEALKEKQSAADTALLEDGDEHLDCSIPNDNLNSLKEAIECCERCFKPSEHNLRSMGIGNEHKPKLMVVLNPATQRELNDNKVLSGRSALIFEHVLKALKLSENDVYVTHASHCGVRNHENASDIAVACRGFLQQQITIIAPNVVLALGEIAAQSALITREPLERLRNETHTLDNGIKLRASYHPFDLLERPANKARAWQDIRSLLALIHPEE